MKPCTNHPIAGLDFAIGMRILRDDYEFVKKAEPDLEKLISKILAEPTPDPMTMDNYEDRQKRALIKELAACSDPECEYKRREKDSD